LGHGFPREEWRHFLRGPESRALLHVAPTDEVPYVDAATADTENNWVVGLREWVQSFHLIAEPDSGKSHHGEDFRWARFGREDSLNKDLPFTVAAYAPARALSYVNTAVEMDALRHPSHNSLGFESAIQNGAIQRWLVDLFSRKALAKERGQEFGSYEQSLNRFQEALRLVCGDENVRIDVELRPSLEPRLYFRGRALNFSQLADGVRTTVGWLADFMMRQDQTRRTNGEGAEEPGILLLDEVDIYLHPRWQRILLPAIRRALPNVQIIASSHSPFVISSCEGARVHVLSLDEHGVAHAAPPQDAPFGESVTATLKDIFGVESRFDAETEQDLKVWDNLKRAEAVGSLTPAERKQLEKLSHKLSKRSEELKLIVDTTVRLPAGLLNGLESQTIGKPARPRASKKKRPGVEAPGRSRRGVKLA
jgi:hypothetical protein